MGQKDNNTYYYVYMVFDKKDARWARWLGIQFKTYRLPHQNQTANSMAHIRYRPIFHSSTILEAGHEGIKIPIDQAKYLLIICSRDSLIGENEINAVIDRFLANGAAPENVIPFIVDKSSRPETECFPTGLQALSGEKTILGANIHDSGSRNAFLKVLAYMYGLKLESLESEDRRRRKKNQKKLFAAMICLLIFIFVIVYLGWDYYVPKTKHYTDFTEVYGMPSGINEIKNDELAEYEDFYTIISSQRKVREMRHENIIGQLCTDAKKTEQNFPVRAIYEYDDDGELQKQKCYDVNNSLYLTMEYRNKNTIDLYYDYDNKDTSRYIKTHLSYTDAVDSRKYNQDTISQLYLINLTNTLSGLDFYDAIGDDGKMEIKTGYDEILRYLVSYDEKGYLSELHYCSSDVYNTIAYDENGISGFSFRHDEKGRLINVDYLAYIGSTGSADIVGEYTVLETKEGISSVRYEYDQNKLKKEVFGNNLKENIVCEDGYSSKEYVYDGHRLLEVLYGE